MKRLIFAIFTLSLLLPTLVWADELINVVSGVISSNTVWSPSSGVYIIESGFSVASGTTLTIEPGTIIKAKTTWYGGPSIYGRLIAHGTAESPIYFTSWNDDSVGGDTNKDGPSVGTPGEWQGLYFKEGSMGDFDHIILRYSGYGGFGFGNFVGVENDGGNMRIKNSKISHNYRVVSDGGGGTMTAGSGVTNLSGSLNVSGSIIEDSHNGILIRGGSAVISGNTIRNNIDHTRHRNSGYGLYSYDQNSLTVTNNDFSGNDRTALVDVSKEFIHSGNTSLDLDRRAFQITGVISDNVITLTADDLPYIIESLTVSADGTLTIEPGVIIKMEDRYTNGSIYINGGSLIAKGAPENKIYITSLRDDSIGGDTNGDGNNTIPAPRSWASIFLENGSKAEFENVVLSYGGYHGNGEYLNIPAVIYDRGAELSISDSFLGYNYGAAIYKDAGVAAISESEIANNTYGIYSRGGDITISQSSIHDNAMGVYNQSGVDLGWWWETRPLQIIDARNNWWGDPSGPHDISTSTPTGTGDSVSENVLYKPFLTSWPPTEEPRQINPVIIIPGIMGSAYKNGELLIDPILHTYDDLMATLIANGYQKEVDLFTFPYEWRDSNIFSANLLDDKIEEVKQICLAQNQPDKNCNKVDLVAHSMGGLVARSYIQSADYDGDVDQLIFLGTPHQGSPQAYLQWEGGEFPPGFREFIIQQFFTSEARGNGYKNIFDYIHLRPISSVQELLPIFDYIKDKDTDLLREYPNNYPRNIFLESLNTNTGIQKLLNSGVQITNILGNTGSNTIENIIVVPSSDDEKWMHGEADSFEMGVGDGTVTAYGATLNHSVPNEEWNDVSHLRLPRETSARVFNILTDKIADHVVYLSLIEKVFAIQLQSPIDVLVTAPDGRRMGKNFETGEEYNEIPLAFYSGYQTDDEYITIPNPTDGEYKIELQGTDNGGEYTVVTTYISDDTAVSTEFFGVTGPDQMTNLSVDVDNANPENMELERTDVLTSSDLINHINVSYNLGWIKDEKTKNKLLRWAESIVRFEEKSDTIGALERVVDIKLALLLYNELPRMLNKGDINNYAYYLLKTDLEYLINNN